MTVRDDILDEPTITRPLPDKVTKREFLPTLYEEDPIYFDDDFMDSDFPPIPFTQKDVAHQVKTRQQINAIDPLRYSSMVNCGDCGFLDEGAHCLVHGEINFPDALRNCEAFSVKNMCA